MSSPNVVLVVGDSGCGKSFLVESLGGRGVSDAAAVAHGFEVATLELDTKYYSAALAVHTLPPDTHARFAEAEAETDAAHEGGGALSAAARAHFGQLQSAVQALVLVFSLARPSSFHSLVSAWADFAQNRQPDVMLLVGNAEAAGGDAKQSAAEREELEQLAKDWALDHQIEYVHLPWNDKLQAPQVRLATPATANAAAARPRAGSEDEDEDLEAAGEPVGLARIRESLECNQWSELTMKERRGAAYAPNASASAGMSHLDEALEDEAKEAAAFASMQLQREPSTDDQFDQFVSASNTTTAAPVSSSNASSASKAAASASASASSSAFANAFARAIRMPDPKPSAPAPVPAAPSASTDGALDDATHAEDMDVLVRELASMSSKSAEADTRAAADAVEADTSDAQGDAFDSIFEKIAAMKSAINQVRADGSKLSDAERRAMAEANVRFLMKSLGMEDELGDDDDDDDDDDEM